MGRVIIICLPNSCQNSNKLATRSSTKILQLEQSSGNELLFEMNINHSPLDDENVHFLATQNQLVSVSHSGEKITKLKELHIFSMLNFIT